MPSTFINPVVNPDTALGVATFDETAPVRRWPNSSSDEIQTVLRAIYRQVLGNAYVMESERLQSPESRFRQGELSVVEFIRQIAQSDLYRTRFFENGPRNRFIELNFKHFLGRAPESQAELAMHSAILDNEGYEAEINSYLDSEEYYRAFGDDTVPFYRGFKTGAATKLVAFTHIFPLLRGASSSDKHLSTNNPARLNGRLFSNQASSVVSPSGATSRRGSGVQTSGDNWMQKMFEQQSAAKAKADRPAADRAAQPGEGMNESELSQTAQSQAEQIKQLEAQLNDLRSLSNMGAAILRKGQRNAAGTDDMYARSAGSNRSSLKGEVETQASRIEQLQGELMSARSLAAIAESKLNRWRQRSY